jgi:Dyp-type peroxidase family
MDHKGGAAVMSVDLADTGIDHKAEKYQKMLANLQGNILKGHGRDRSVHMFLTFTSEPHAVRRWICGFADRYVTSASQQLKEAEEFNKYRIPGGLFANFFLTAKGYETLGFTKDEIASRFPEEPAVVGGREVVATKFRDGMAFYQEELNDPDPATWEEAYQGRRIDAMILLADDDEGFLLRQARAVLEDVQAVADVLAVEHGRVMRNEAGESIEHFGYVDGRSQPLFLQTDVESKVEKGGIDKWDPTAPLGLVLVADPNVEKEEDCFGSYFVFRKLEQNVRGFKEHEEELAGALGLTGDEAERAGALIVGRFEDGTPVTLSATERLERPVPNNFNYRNDRDATRCPFHAHIRKVNPRGDTASIEEERQHRVVRRGITYGERQVEPKDDPSLDQMPTHGVGLLFMCFQSSLANQFGFLQKVYANSPDFVHEGTGFDPVIGQRSSAAKAIQQRWPVKWGQSDLGSFDFGGFVTFVGGEFFFAPSIPFLKSL